MDDPSASDRESYCRNPVPAPVLGPVADVPVPAPPASASPPGWIPGNVHDRVRRTGRAGEVVEGAGTGS